MDPITIAMGLASAAPALIRWLTGDDKSKVAKYAEQAISVAQAVTGKPTGEEALAAIQANAALAKAFQDNVFAFERSWLEEETKRLESVNQTMRVEATSADPWQRRWRPFWGFLSAIQFNVCATGIIGIAGYAIYKRDVEMIRSLPDLVTALAMLFTIPGAILGVASWLRGKTQLEQAKIR
jgi:hypothetical protein